MRVGAGWVAQLIGVWSVAPYTKKVVGLSPVRACASGRQPTDVPQPHPASPFSKINKYTLE